jgi:outer membrane protein assembly factor BamB
MGRRRALAMLAGMATAGVGVAGWKLAGAATRTGGGNLTADQSAGKTIPPGTKVWGVNAGATVQAVAVAGNVVYAGTSGNTVLAIDAVTGTEIWRRASTSQFNGPLAVAGGTLIVSGDTSLYALAADGGQPRWHVATTEGSIALKVADGTVYAGIAPKNPTTGGVTAFSASDGELLWTYPFGPVADVAGGLAVTAGVVYVTTTNGEIFTLSAAAGTRQRRISGSFGKFGAGAVAVVDGVLYAGGDNDNGAVFAVNAATGKTRWQRDLAASASPAYLTAGNGVVFAGLLRNPQSAGLAAGGLYALNGVTGQTLWSVPVAGGVNLAPAVAGDAVYTGSENGVLDAWQASTGNKLWSYSLPDAIGSNLGVSGSRVYFSAGDYVYAVAG